MDIRIVGLGIVCAILGIPLMFLNIVHSEPYQALEVYSEKQPYTTYQIEETTQTKTIAQPYIDKETTTRTEYKVVPTYDYTHYWYYDYNLWWGYPYWYYYYSDPYCCGYNYYYPYPYTGCCYYNAYSYYNAYPYYHVDYKTEPYTVTDTDLVIKYKEVQTQQKVLETKQVTEYRDVTKIREVTRNRDKPVLWPQFFGGGLIILGLMTTMGGFFINKR